MNKIEVSILHESHDNPAGMMMFLAKLTMRGHAIKTMADLKVLYNDCCTGKQKVSNLTKLPHNTIKRFTPITIAIVGASRRFLAQARTHQVGINFVSASLQYSDYSGSHNFVMPYELLAKPDMQDKYMDSCNYAMETYEGMIDDGFSNDTAGYAAPQGLRNILIMQANNDAWDHFVRLRACKRNTEETSYVATLIWEQLLISACGPDLFSYMGPDCAHGKCREGSMSCKKPIGVCLPAEIIKERWPCL